MVDGGTVETAPEFVFLDVRVPGRRDHPLLERATSGERRVTYSLRQAPVTRGAQAS